MLNFFIYDPSPAVKMKLESISWKIFLFCCSTVFNFVKFGQLNQLNESYKTKDSRTSKKKNLPSINGLYANKKTVDLVF